MNKSKATILLVEDDVNLGYLLKDYLEMSGYSVDLQKDGEKALETFKARNTEIDLCIIDIMLPTKDGFTLVEEIKYMDRNIPIIFLTAKSMKEDKIKAFQIGADDYITKPFSTEELILRIEAVMRRYKTSINEMLKRDVFHIGKFTFDFYNQQLVSPNQQRGLTKRESDLLHLLCINQNELVRREDALKTIWGENDYYMGRSMDVYITKLRKYLKEDDNINIINVHGTGFKLEVKN